MTVDRVSVKDKLRHSHFPPKQPGQPKPASPGTRGEGRSMCPVCTVKKTIFQVISIIATGLK